MTLLDVRLEPALVPTSFGYLWYAYIDNTAIAMVDNTDLCSPSRVQTLLQAALDRYNAGQWPQFLSR